MSTPVETEATTDHSLTLYGNPAASTVHLRPVTVTDEGEELLGADQTAETDALPNDIAEVTVTSPLTNAVMSPFMLTSFLPATDYSSSVVVLDPNGAVVWYYESPVGIIESARVTSDGLGFSGVAREGEDLSVSEIVHVTWAGVETRIPVPGAHHDLIELPEGGWVTFAREEREIQDLGTVAGDAIVEVNPDGTVSEVWNAFDELDVVENDGWQRSLIPGAADWTHGNGIAYDEVEGAYYLSFYFTQNIVKVDRSTGATVWILGGMEEQFTFEGDEGFGPQHAPELFDGGLRLFDNTTSSSTGSRLVEYAIDEASMTATMTWSWAPEDTNHTLVLGDVTRFEDGSAMASWGISGSLYAIDANGAAAGLWEGPTAEAAGQLTLLPTFYP